LVYIDIYVEGLQLCSLLSHLLSFASKHKSNLASCGACLKVTTHAIKIVNFDDYIGGLKRSTKTIG
jgi:hypothetical protein